MAWIPQPGEGYGRTLGELVTKYEIRGNLMPDAQLAALAIEHGGALCSTDSYFARVRELHWEDPLARVL